MSTCRYIKDVERWFDGEAADTAPIQAHLSNCSVCASHLAWLTSTRAAVEYVRETPEIGDAQFPAFMASVRAGMERPARRIAFRWVLASAAAAVLLAVGSAFSIFSSGPRTVEARSEIEWYTTDIDGAIAESFETEGVPTIWVTVPDIEGDTR